MKPSPGVPLNIWIVVANIGDSKAIVKSVDGRIGRRWSACEKPYRSEDWIDGNDPKDDPNVYVPTRIYLNSGERVPYLIYDEGLAETDVSGIKNKTRELCILGEVVYTDIGGIERRTGFFRVYNERANTFVRPTETDTHYDYEYAD